MSAPPTPGAAAGADRRLTVVLAASEVAPFAKTGGLGDVTAALAAHLHRQGHDVYLFLPRYGRIDSGRYRMAPVAEVQEVPLTAAGHEVRFSLAAAVLPGTSLAVFLVDCPELFGGDAIYGPWESEHLRFGLFTRAVLESCQRLKVAPDVVHAHDWHTALLPLYLESHYRWDQLFARTRTVLTIHNIGYQGTFGAQAVGDLDLRGSSLLLDQEDLAAGRLNVLKTGILHSDMLTTVSPTHAQEIQTPEGGMGLGDLLRARSDRLIGILNGVDYAVWSPESDPQLPATYSAADLSGKAVCRRELLAERGLAPDPDGPVLGIVSRLAYQKGLDLLYEPLAELIAAEDARLVVLGSGEPDVEGYFRALAERYPDKASFANDFNDPLAHRIEAGADLFLMPSRYEPCGLNQMYSLRYGTLPLVRKTGGLADSVRPWDRATGEGTGFVFDTFDSGGVRWALGEALAAWADRPAWDRLVQNAMAEDFSWDRQGALYEALYRGLTGG